MLEIQIYKQNIKIQCRTSLQMLMDEQTDRGQKTTYLLIMLGVYINIYTDVCESS